MHQKTHIATFRVSVNDSLCRFEAQKVRVFEVQWSQGNLGGRASQVAKREIFLALIEHGPHHFFHKQLLNTHIAFEQLLNAHILLLNCSTCTMAIMLAQPIEKNTLLNGFSAFNVSLHCSVLKPLWATQTLWGLFCNGFSKKSMHH